MSQRCRALCLTQTKPGCITDIFLRNNCDNPLLITMCNVQHKDTECIIVSLITLLWDRFVFLFFFEAVEICSNIHSRVVLNQIIHDIGAVTSISTVYLPFQWSCLPVSLGVLSRCGKPTTSSVSIQPTGM